MKIKVYKGTHEIGGTCIEIKAGNGKTLWIDLGLPLSNASSNVDYAHNSKPDALLISHSHQDHYGLMEHLDSKIPIYIGQVSRDLINATRMFLDRPLSTQNFKVIEPWESYYIADTFTVKPFLVDHSSPEAFAFLIEADGKRIFYSGDFRATGNKKVLYENLVKDPPKDIDLLFIEGTMVERNNHAYPTEKAVEKALLNLIKEQKNVSFVVSSAQNIDRFVSVRNVCHDTHKKVVIDIYNAWVLDMVKKKSPKLPYLESPEILVYNHPGQLEKISAPGFDEFRERVERNSIGNKVFDSPANFVYFLRCPNTVFIDALRQYGTMNLIYSQWEGYLQEQHKNYYTDTLNALKNDSGIRFSSIHTSGHATMHELKELAAAMHPKQIVPIHTEHPNKFQQEFEKEGFKNVTIWEDNNEYQL